MAPTKKTDRKAVVDVAAWTFNVVTSVGVIIVNKALMATYGFSYELLKFILFANFSIVGMNVSLMWNSVGFYQNL
ncbi:hypothetical protein V6N13_075607 [Hibiscus sabdariffa]|uniref:Uncharacterized protein n=1 Tax=Hibiscus sabdariffa TaxID=183260 RepID=A0ABR2UC33_9ROSI